MDVEPSSEQAPSSKLFSCSFHMHVLCLFKADHKRDCVVCKLKSISYECPLHAGVHIFYLCMGMYIPDVYMSGILCVYMYMLCIQSACVCAC